jgi:1-deoxy-D-xylulose-5-phosphate reductoisomerase
MSRNVVVLGSTGSIGRQTLDVARSMPERVSVYGLAARSSLDTLSGQCREFRPRVVSIGEAALGLDGFAGTEVLRGDDGMVEMVSRPEVDLVVVGTAGGAGLRPTLAALRAGKLVALANKETLVMAGAVIQSELKSGQGRLVPIDSEHSAIWQCLQGEPNRSVERLTLTASGGALRHLDVTDLGHVTPEQALRHPTWSMGAKITVDSANLMNKGLELIEARWLFDVALERIDVVMHPQSIVHSLVTFDDSSTKAQLGLPDMRLPIQYALSHPDRWPNDLPRLDLATTGNLSFGPVDLDRYPSLRIAMRAGEEGGTYPAVLSAADEVAVQAFLERRIRFTGIPDVVDAVLQQHDSCRVPTLDDILQCDTWARMVAGDIIARA